MVVGNGKTCSTCGLALPACHCWVRVDFSIPKSMINPDSSLNKDSFDIEFCSLNCLSQFDWSKLKTKQQWMKAHREGLK